jgi:hypothetical protein
MPWNRPIGTGEIWRAPLIFGLLRTLSGRTLKDTPHSKEERAGLDFQLIS